MAGLAETGVIGSITHFVPLYLRSLRGRTREDSFWVTYAAALLAAHGL